MICKKGDLVGDIGLILHLIFLKTFLLLCCLKPIKKVHSFKQKNYPHLKVEIIKCSPFDSLLIHFKTQNTTLDSLINT